jgi:hypothetical protein
MKISGTTGQILSKLERKCEYCSVYICSSHVEEDEMGGSCSTYGEKRNAYRLLVRKPEGKRPQEDQDVGGWIILG